MNSVIQSGKQKDASPTSVLVSVVIPAYQCAAYIAETLNSVLTQTFSGYEILVVNDGSPDTDELERVLAPFMDSIRYIKQPNGGPSSARNRGIRESRGKYIAFLDSDDLWLPNHLEQQVKLLESNPSLALVYSDAILLKGDLPMGRTFARHPQDLEVTFEALVAERCTIGTSTVVASKRAILEAGGFEEARRRSEDFDLWLRMAHRGAAMRYSEGAQVWHRAGNGLAVDDTVMKKAQIDVYEKILLALPITGSQAELVCDKTQQLQARLLTDTVKESLRRGRFPEALAAATQANVALKSAKLSLVAAGLRFFPHALRAAFCAYERFQEQTQLKSQKRFLRELGGANPNGPGAAAVVVDAAKMRSAVESVSQKGART